MHLHTMGSAALCRKQPDVAFLTYPNSDFNNSDAFFKQTLIMIGDCTHSLQIQK